MTADELRKLREHYFSLIGQKEVFDRHPTPFIAPQPATVLQDEMNSLETDFPGLIPEFDLKRFYNRVGGADRYDCLGIQTYLASIVGKLKAVIDANEPKAIFQEQDFKFITDPEIRKILVRDYEEIQRAVVSNCWKSVIIFVGGAIEAILLDLLERDPAKARASANAPREQDLKKWDLADLIKVSVDLKLVSDAVEKLSDPIREYRNLIHPGNEIRRKLKFDAGEAKIAFEVLGIVCRDLS